MWSERYGYVSVLETSIAYETLTGLYEENLFPRMIGNLTVFTGFSAQSQWQFTRQFVWSGCFYI